MAGACRALGFQSLVPGLWKKPTNKPNAFLGSGFLPTNAYVTLDWGIILLFRKGGAREREKKGVGYEANEGLRGHVPARVADGPAAPADIIRRIRASYAATPEPTA